MNSVTKMVFVLLNSVFSTIYTTWTKTRVINNFHVIKSIKKMRSKFHSRRVWNENSEMSLITLKAK